MNTHPATPIGPDGEEPLSDLFREIRDLADQVSSRISDDEVETRLRRVMRRAGQRGSTGADNAPVTVPLDKAAAKALLHHQSLMPPSREIHELMQAIARARSELTAARMEMRQTFELARTVYAEAEKARAEAATAYANATKVMSDVQAYHDAALNSAAMIIGEAKAAAEEIRQAYANAAQAMSDVQAYHDATLNNFRSMTREATAAAEEIKRAARAATDRRAPYRAERQTSNLLRSQNPSGARLAFIVDGTSRMAEQAEQATGWGKLLADNMPNAVAWLWAGNNNGLPILALLRNNNTPQPWTGSNAAPHPLAVDNSPYGSDLPSISEGRVFICGHQTSLVRKVLGVRGEITFDYGTQDSSGDPGDISQPQPTRNN